MYTIFPQWSLQLKKIEHHFYETVGSITNIHLHITKIQTYLQMMKGMVK